MDSTRQNDCGEIGVFKVTETLTADVIADIHTDPGALVEILPQCVPEYPEQSRYAASRGHLICVSVKNKKNKPITKNLSGLQLIYTDFDEWICKFDEHINSRSSNFLNETEISVEECALKIKGKENENLNNSRDQNLGVLSLQDAFVDGILLRNRINYRTDKKNNLSHLFRVNEDYNEIYDYVLFQFVNSRNKISCDNIKCKL